LSSGSYSFVRISLRLSSQCPFSGECALNCAPLIGGSFYRGWLSFGGFDIVTVSPGGLARPFPVLCSSESTPPPPYDICGASHAIAFILFFCAALERVFGVWPPPSPRTSPHAHTPRPLHWFPPQQTEPSTSPRHTHRRLPDYCEPRT